MHSWTETLFECQRRAWCAKEYLLIPDLFKLNQYLANSYRDANDVRAMHVAKVKLSSSKLARGENLPQQADLA